MKEAPYAWVVVWATFFALAIIFGVSYSFAAFFASFAGEFNAQRADVSLVFGLSGGVYFVFGAGAGMLADRFGPRAVTSAGMLLIAAGLLVCSFANSMAMVYAAYGVGVGLGIALVYTPAIACVQPWFTQRRGLAAGLRAAAGTEPRLAQLQHVLRRRARQRLMVGVGADELNALHAAPDHVLDGVAAGAADSHHLDDRAARFGFQYLECHGALLLRVW